MQRGPETPPARRESSMRPRGLQHKVGILAVRASRLFGNTPQRLQRIELGTAVRQKKELNVQLRRLTSRRLGSMAEVFIEYQGDGAFP